MSSNNDILHVIILDIPSSTFRERQQTSPNWLDVFWQLFLEVMYEIYETMLDV